MLLANLIPIPGHAVFLLLVQLALLLVVARAGALFSKSIGLPAVVGELAAGIVLGPSVFGHYLPGAFALVFPAESLQFNLLEVVGILGMTLLLLLTGLETDLRLLKNLGRAALIASAMGMVVPFGMGFGLGMVMPEAYVAQPDQRLLFALFLATAMAISAMPVIAKILMDLGLTKRNIGLVILSAGVVDDTAGWLVLSAIAGAATHGGSPRMVDLALTLSWLAAFLVAMALVVYPLLRFLLRLNATQRRGSDNDLVLIVAATFACAAISEHIGVHAVFGAFVCGTALRQVPHLDAKTVHRLESFVFSILAPIFFGIVGLKVDLWTLGGGTMLGVVLAIACLGKLLGCTLGGLWGGMSFWEALSIAVAMNARGAMELVVATIGLSLGILNQQMFSMIVVVAIVTSFMAPLALRWTMKRVRMTEDEHRRLLLEASRGVFDPERLRVLISSRAGLNDLGAAAIGISLGSRSQYVPTIVLVEEQEVWWRRLKRFFTRAQLAQTDRDEHLDALLKLSEAGRAPRVRKRAGKNPERDLLADADKADLLVLGAPNNDLDRGALEDIVVDAPCHVAIVRAAANSAAPHRRVFVPLDGSAVARIAAEFALRYAEAVNATLTLALISESPTPNGTFNSKTEPALDRSSPPPSDIDAELLRISPVFRTSSLTPEVRYLAEEAPHGAMAREISQGDYDLVVLGAENRAIQHRLFFGHEAQRIIEGTEVSLIVLVPNIKRPVPASAA